MDSRKPLMQKYKIAGPHAQAEMILISAAIEAEIAQLDTKEERKEFIEAIGPDEPEETK